ncbi:MAG: S9 family peptidase [Gammaproteobacteria bacterium]|nr:MAG: S9 family peptidase [Gammaproteobacteria bacterium]
MTKFSYVTVLLATMGLAFSVAANTTWDNPDDIPVIEPVSVGLAGEKPADIVRYLMARGAESALISPDGTKIAFRYTVTGERQLWIVDAGGGWPTQLTFGSGITFYRWAPDGRHLLVGRDADGNEREGYYLLSVDGTEERQLLPLTDAFRVFGMFSTDGSQFLFSSTERNGRDFDIYVSDVASGETQLVYEGSFGFFPRAWQPDGNIVIVAETRGEDAADVHLLNMESGEMTPLFQPDVAASYSNFTWLPDGSGFYLATNHDREFAGLAFYSLQDSKLTFLETPDADISNVTMNGNGRYLAWTTNEDGYAKLHTVDRNAQGSLATPALPPGIYQLDMSSAASSISIRVTGPATPGDVFVWNIESDTTHQAVQSSLAGLDPESFKTPLSLRYPARDGIELQGLLYLPDPSQVSLLPPVVVSVHGGPTGQSRPVFKSQVQYLLNNGIAVFDVNVRGSTGFGKTYARLDNQEKRLDSVRDLVDTVAFLSKDARLDTQRIAVMGGSYGGYMVNAVLGSYPGVFDAGVSMVGVSDWVRALQEASPALKASDRIEYGDIREERWQEFYKVNSPINNAANINVPLLVEHGANDPRDPVTESDRLVTAIREAGGTVTYMRFPDEGHSLAKQANRVAYYRTMVGFLERQLKPVDIDAADEAGDH